MSTRIPWLIETMLDFSLMMQRAIDVAKQNANAPFGCVLYDFERSEIAAEGVNAAKTNPILHGEMAAISNYAATGIQRWDKLWLYTTAEPCCMCQAAIVWAGIPKVVFGTSIATLAALGWSQFELTAQQLVDRTPFAECEIIGGVLERECDELFRQASR